MNDTAPLRRMIVAMTGASGAAYGLRLIQRLAMQGIEQHLLFSDAARVVLKQETDVALPDAARDAAATLAEHLDVPCSGLTSYALDDWFSPAASGSSGMEAMIVAPCSMGALARIAVGASDNLIERAADVMLKERRRLVLMPRETPLSGIHLEHMLKLSNMGAHILPAMPGFYHRPTCMEDLIDFVVDRALMHLGVDAEGMKTWGG